MVGVPDAYPTAYLQAGKIWLVKKQASIVTIETGHLSEMYSKSFRIISNTMVFLLRTKAGKH